MESVTGCENSQVLCLSSSSSSSSPPLPVPRSHASSFLLLPSLLPAQKSTPYLISCAAGSNLRSVWAEALKDNAITNLRCQTMSGGVHIVIPKSFFALFHRMNSTLLFSFLRLGNYIYINCHLLFFPFFLSHSVTRLSRLTSVFFVSAVTSRRCLCALLTATVPPTLSWQSYTLKGSYVTAAAALADHLPPASFIIKYVRALAFTVCYVDHLNRAWMPQVLTNGTRMPEE